MSNLLKDNKKLMEEYDYEKNIDVDVNKLTTGLSKKIWWKCKKGHSYMQSLNNKMKTQGCPICNKEKVTSFQEKIVLFYAKKYFKDVIDNYRTKELGKREIDIFIPSINVGIEYDGGYYHNEPKNDILKDSICDNVGIKLYRIRDNKCPVLNSTSICFYRKDKSNKDLESILIQLLKDLGISKVDINIDRDLDQIYDDMDYSNKEKSLLIVNPDLAKEWNYEKNGKLKPEHIYPNSSKKVWWKCDKGHEYQSTVNHRNRGQKCPYCSGHKVLKGFNDLGTTNPELLKRWDYDKNVKLSPEEVSFGSGIAIWWKCDKGHSYKRIIKAELNSSKCPVCNPITMNDRNDIVKVVMKLEKEWNYEKNKNSLIDSFDILSKKHWWTCKNNHDYEMNISDRYKGLGCPYCSGQRVLKGFNDIGTTNPELLKEWNYEKNIDITPYEVSKGSNIKVWWKCDNGHEWQSVVHSRVKGSGCPYCNSNSKKINQYTKEGKFIRQFNSLKEAGESVGISGTGINYACNNKTLTNNYQWRFNDGNTNDIGTYVRNNNCIKKVDQYTLDNKYIKTFDSLIEATKETGARKISEVCKGKRKTSGGYVWKYDEDNK